MCVHGISRPTILSRLYSPFTDKCSKACSTLLSVVRLTVPVCFGQGQRASRAPGQEPWEQRVYTSSMDIISEPGTFRQCVN